MLPYTDKELNESHLQALIDEKVGEGPTLEFKKGFPPATPEGKAEFCKDICAMANSRGGDIIYGIAEDGNGKASALAPIEGKDDQLRRQWDEVLSRGIEARLFGYRFLTIPIARGGHAYVIRLQRSSGLHRAVGANIFYSRPTSSAVAMDVPAIVAKVEGGLNRQSKEQEFFARRYAGILTNAYYLPFAEGHKVCVHLVPVTEFLGDQRLDLKKFQNTMSVPMFSSRYDRGVPTFDGLLWYANLEGSMTASTLAMHNGVIESVTHLEAPKAQVPTFWIGLAEYCIIKHFQSLFTGIGVIPDEAPSYPFVARVTILGANGTTGLRSRNPDDERVSHSKIVNQEAVLCLPDIYFDKKPDEQELLGKLEPVLQRMWQAWGYPDSYYLLKKAGQWEYQANRRW